MPLKVSLAIMTGPTASVVRDLTSPHCHALVQLPRRIPELAIGQLVVCRPAEHLFGQPTCTGLEAPYAHSRVRPPACQQVQ